MKSRHLLPWKLVCVVCLGLLSPANTAGENKPSAQAKKSEPPSLQQNIIVADLTIKIIRSQTIAYAGEKLKLVQACCKNIGKAKTVENGYITMFLVLSKDALIPLKWPNPNARFKEDMWLGVGKGNVSTLAPGESWCENDFSGSDGSRPMMIPADTPAGDYFLGMVVNPDAPSHVPEFTRENNTHCVPIKILNRNPVIKRRHIQ